MLGYIVLFILSAAVIAFFATCRYTYVRVGPGNKKRVWECAVCYGAIVVLCVANYVFWDYFGHAQQPLIVNLLFVAGFVVGSLAFASICLGLVDEERSRVAD